MAIMSKEEKKETTKEIEVITAVYKVNLHCPKCAHDIRRPLLRTPGMNYIRLQIRFIEKLKMLLIHPKTKNANVVLLLIKRNPSNKTLIEKCNYSIRVGTFILKQDIISLILRWHVYRFFI